MHSEVVAHKKRTPHKCLLVDFDEVQRPHQTQFADAENVAGNQEGPSNAVTAA